MNQVKRLEVLLALTAQVETLLADEVDSEWPYLPNNMAYLMANGAMQVLDVVVATEATYEADGLLVEDPAAGVVVA
jgi:hypothetical protein